jgi:hypothetical protein
MNGVGLIEHWVQFMSFSAGYEELNTDITPHPRPSKAIVGFKYLGHATLAFLALLIVTRYWIF